MCILSPLPYLLATGPAHAQGWATWGCEHQEARDLGGPAESVHSFSLRSHCISCTLYILYTIVHSFFSQFCENLKNMEFCVTLCKMHRPIWETIIPFKIMSIFITMDYFSYYLWSFSDSQWKPNLRLGFQVWSCNSAPRCISEKTKRSMYPQCS